MKPLIELLVVLSFIGINVMRLSVTKVQYSEKYNRHIVTISNGIRSIRMHVINDIAKPYNGIKLPDEYYQIALKSVGINNV